MSVITIKTAIRIIKSHGHKAVETPDGLIATCEAVQNGVVFDASTTFYVLPKIDTNFNYYVSKEAIMNWLGY